ncbi:hypothetical protein [Brevundimonas sp.]|uniref:hypothetical protein n=1 Tax=Brevundimonas sp. TaxID=1871086 RepID=UPI002D4ABA8C|nr:hypothetical protein [Brevundimonas sp.]HYC67311.1 hypothetical protein [Brevundimonas sp.]
MRALHLHMPRLGRRPMAGHGAAHHHLSSGERFWRLERAFDYLVVAGIVILGGFMVYGLATASGDASWF